MKVKYIKYALLSTVLTLGACSNDYLDTFPTNSTSPSTVFQNTDNVEMAVNGLAKIMVTQHISQGFNGEGTIKMYYGEYPGNNFRKDFAGWASIINGTFLDNNTSSYGSFPWHYYYMLITNANEIVDKVDDVDGPEKTKKYLKAQALTYRAYAYTMLAQLYGYRWVDSNNGEHNCLPIRLHSTDPKSLPLAPLKDVYAQVYKDLDQAIALFDESGYKRKENHQVDANVAHAVYARAAITKQDYTTAAREANLARVGYPLMSVKEYQDGFANPNKEWIWSSFGAADEQLHFWSYQAYMAYNSSASVVRSYPNRMSKELFETIPEKDLRRQVFLDPTGYDQNTYSAATGVAAAKSKLDLDTRERFPELKSNALVAAYMQLKIGANDMPGVGHTNHFRSSEMYLIEAEALHFLNKDTEAAALLVELTKTSGRDPDYTCNKTGTELFKEIVKYRGIELWGEGFDWFDYKRWNLAIDRKSSDEGGNYTTSLAKTIQPSENNKWTWRTPAKETDFQ